MSIEPRTATVRVDVLKVHSKLIPEPDWCTGQHDGAQFRPDLGHQGPDVSLTFHGHHVADACLTQTPYARRASRRPQVSVSLLGNSLDPEGLYDFAAALDGYADRLRALADQLATILAGGEGR